MASAEVEALENTEPETVPGYRPPARKSISELQSMDEDDPSLVQYKKSLLSIDEGCAPEDDPRKVIVEEMAFVVAGRDDITFDLSQQHPETMKLTVKEGTEYRIRMGFKIHHEIVPGLRYHHVIKRSGIAADKQTYMVGSYGPKSQQQQWTSPVEDAPKGALYRGNYKIHSKFLDDDDEVHLEWDWEMNIKKEWEEE